MQRLSASTRLPPAVATPAYDRSKLKPGILHIGFGAFHRAHQAVYTDLALAREFGDWGIIGASLRSLQPISDLRTQDHLFSVTARCATGDDIRLVGSVIGGIAATRDRAALLDLLADSSIRIVSLTVTEKAYGLDSATGGLDLQHPSVAADVSNPAFPIGVIGFIVEGLARRRAAGTLPFTVLCCDNLPTNGRVVRRLVLEMAETRDPALAAWIAEHGAFPSTMVDRIVPAATDETRFRASTLLGAEDTLALDTEPFMQWVIEDQFVSGRPAWEAAGALLVKDVEPYEKMKLRVLNGTHSMIAYLGQLTGLEYVRDVTADADHVARIRRHMQAAAGTLDPIPGINLAAYQEQLIERFSNPMIAHRTRQIAMDGSQKLPQRIFAAAVDDLAAGRDGAAFADTTALWIAYISSAHEIDDPRGEQLRQATRQIDDHDPTASLFDLPALIPAELVDNLTWRKQVNQSLAKIMQGSVVP